MLLLCLVVLAAGPAVKVKVKGKAKVEVSPLSVVKVGDYVEYDFAVQLEGPLTRLRAQAAVIDGTRIAVDVRPVAGPSRRWLAPGVRLWLESKGKAKENDFSSEGNLETAEGTPTEETRAGQSFACVRVEFDQSRGDGPKGTACLRSKDPRLALGNGLVDLHSRSSGMGGAGGYDITLVSAGNAPVGPSAVEAWPEGNSVMTWTGRGSRARDQRERISVSSVGGRIVEVTTRWEASFGDDRVDLKFGGLGWVEITTDDWASTLPRYLLSLVGARYLPQVPKSAKAGPAFTAGPLPVETLVYEEGGARLTVVAKPESAAQLPVALRYGVLKRAAIAGPSEHDFEVIEWK